MGQDPSVIREEIAQTRERVGDEVDALSYKTDVGARVGDYVDDKKDAVKSKLSGAKDAITGAVPDGDKMKRRAGGLRDSAERNPIGLALVGVGVGFVAGTLLPRTRVEDEKLGDVSDRVVDVAKQTAGEAVERGKGVAQDAVEAAVDTARESGREQGEQLASTLQERAQDGVSTGA